MRNQGLDSQFRRLKTRIYRLFPSYNPWCHEKRRKGLQRSFAGSEIIECQLEQDRIFLGNFLTKNQTGLFWEVGCGDGTTGSCTLALELHLGWKGLLWEPSSHPRRQAGIRRSALVMEPENPDVLLNHGIPDLVVIRRPKEFPWVWDMLENKKIRPSWVVVENPRPAIDWVHMLESGNFRLRWFFHDDEYFEARKC